MLTDIAAYAKRGKKAVPISPVALEAVKRIDVLFDIERDINGLYATERMAQRQQRSTPLVEALHDWLQSGRSKLSRSSPVAEPIDYMLKRWNSFITFLHDGRVSQAREQIQRRLKGRCSSSSLPSVIDSILSRPIVSTAMVAKTTKLTPRGALNLISELGIRELTGSNGVSADDPPMSLHHCCAYRMEIVTSIEGTKLNSKTGVFNVIILDNILLFMNLLGLKSFIEGTDYRILYMRFLYFTAFPSLEPLCGLMS